MKKYILIFITTLFISCGSLKTAPFDQYSYQKTIEIKFDALDLIDKATSNYEDHKLEVQNLENEIEKILEYERYKPNNEITYEIWKILSNKEKNLLSAFFKRWKEKKTLNSFFIKEAKQQITEAMNILIQYEGKKEPEIKNQLLQIISSN